MKLPQLSLRELFLWVLVAAMGLGWFTAYWQWQRERRELINTQNQLNSSMTRYYYALIASASDWAVETKRPVEIEIKAMPGLPARTLYSYPDGKQSYKPLSED